MKTRVVTGVVLVALISLVIWLGGWWLRGVAPVSYTHLDVYKRQLPCPCRYIQISSGSLLCRLLDGVFSV